MELYVLTCCPPAPDERSKRIFASVLGRESTLKFERHCLAAAYSSSSYSCSGLPLEENLGRGKRDTQTEELPNKHGKDSTLELTAHMGSILTTITGILMSDSRPLVEVQSMGMVRCASAAFDGSGSRSGPAPLNKAY